MAQTTRVVVGKRRQITLPAAVCERLGIMAGDELDLSINGDAIVLRGQSTTARSTLNVLMRAFGAAGAADDAPRPPVRPIRRRSGSRKP